MVVAANITEQLQSRYQTFYGQAVVKIPHFITRWDLGTRLEKLLKYRDASNFSHDFPRQYFHFLPTLLNSILKFKYHSRNLPTALRRSHFSTKKGFYLFQPVPKSLLSRNETKTYLTALSPGSNLSRNTMRKLSEVLLRYLELIKPLNGLLVNQVNKPTIYFML